MRASQMLLPTVKEDPAGAEAVSHKLMVRAGLARQLSAGVYVFLPAGWRVMQKIAAIIRDEQDAIGAQEILMPVLNPAEIWEESGRYHEIGDELFRLKDRKGTPHVLAMTHEEVITWLAAREIRSYKQLPQMWYQIQTKERDEARPKSGLLRTREFIMKDAYSLDTDEEALQANYELQKGAYDRTFRRCGLRFIMVQSDPGMMGGRIAHEYMAFSEAGEDEVVFCTSCGYAANVELAVAAGEPQAPLGAAEAGGAAAATARAALAAAEAAQAAEPAGSAEQAATDAQAAGKTPEAPAPPAAGRLAEVLTPDTRTIAAVTAFLQVPSERLMKTLIVVREPGGGEGGSTAAGQPDAESLAERAVMALVRGDHDLMESKLRRHIGDFRMATADEVRELQGAEAGFVGPLSLAADGTRAALTALPLFVDDCLRAGSYVGGANRDDHHLAGIVPADLAGARYLDLRRVGAGAHCHECGAELRGERVIEIGNIFQLGIKYSAPMGATYLDEAGAEKTVIMGSYGIGLARVAAAAVEQSHDENGIVWPATLAPYDVQLVCVRPADEAQHELAERLYAELRSAGLDVLYDDRDVSAGIKFKDADLLGCPLQVIVGKRAADGVVELKERADGRRDETPAAAVAARVRTRIDELVLALS